MTRTYVFRDQTSALSRFKDPLAKSENRVIDDIRESTLDFSKQSKIYDFFKDDRGTSWCLSWMGKSQDEAEFKLWTTDKTPRTADDVNYIAEGLKKSEAIELYSSILGRKHDEILSGFAKAIKLPKLVSKIEKSISEETELEKAIRLRHAPVKYLRKEGRKYIYEEPKSKDESRYDEKAWTERVMHILAAEEEIENAQTHYNNLSNDAFRESNKFSNRLSVASVKSAPKLAKKRDDAEKIVGQAENEDCRLASADQKLQKIKDRMIYKLAALVHKEKKRSNGYGRSEGKKPRFNIDKLKGLVVMLGGEHVLDKLKNQDIANDELVKTRISSLYDDKKTALESAFNESDNELKEVKTGYGKKYAWFEKKNLRNN